MTAPSVAAGRHAAAVPSPPDRAGFALTLAVLGVFVTYVPITAVAVSLTEIGRATGAGTSDLQWIQDAYVIPMAAAVLSAGAFGDLYGRRLVYLLGMTLTIAGAATAGAAGLLSGADAVHLLWGGQAVAGLGAGLLLPTTLAVVAHVARDGRERGRNIGLWASGLMSGLAVGPLVSGLVLQQLGWGWIFVPTAALSVIAVALAFRYLPDSRAARGEHVDWPGQVMATIAIVGSIFGIIEGGEKGWSSAEALLGLSIGALALLIFLVVESRSSSPLVALRLFRSPEFSAAGFAAMVALFSVVGAMFLLSLFLGFSQHLSPLEIGVRMLFVTGVGTLVNPFVGHLTGRVAPATLLPVGLGLAGVGIFCLAQIDETTGLGDLAWRLAVFGVALAVTLTSVSGAAIGAVPWQLAGMAAATNTALRQYGGALGPAILGAVYQARVRDGATATEAFHDALLLNAGLLAVATVACLVAARRPRVEISV